MRVLRALIFALVFQLVVVNAAVRDSTVATGNTSGGTGLSVAVPAGAAANDIGIISVTIDDVDATMTVTGFTALGTVSHPTLDGQSTGIFWKRLTGADSGNYTGTFGMAGVTNSWIVEAVLLSGRHLTDPPVHTQATNSTGNTSPVSINATTITALLNDDLIWIGSPDVSVSGAANVFTQPTGYTTLESAENAFSNLYTASKEAVAAGATGTVTGTITLTSGTSGWSAFLIRIPALPVGITFDAASNSGYQAAASTYSWSHTCTGSNRYLRVGVGMLSLAQTVSGITYAGVAMTFIGAQASVSGAARVEIWGLVACSTGANNIEVTLTGAIASAGVAKSYAGVHQTSPIEGLNGAQATNVGAADATVDITTVADNDWVVDVVATDDTAITVGAGQTQRNNVTGAGGSVADSDEGPKTPAGAVTMSWTNVAALATWATAGVALRPVAAANLGGPPTLGMMGVGR